MKSPINWALLALVIERPSDASELARRFERTYRGALSLSGKPHVYAALGALTSRLLIEEIPGPRMGRQPKPHYRASAKGLEGYREWFLSQVREDRERQRLIVLQLGALTRHREAALKLLERYEQAWLEGTHDAFLPSVNGERDQGSDFVAALLSEENRLVVEAKLSWVGYARAMLKDLAPA
jgi:DNA-binding PadR family transcriptional regulator